MQQINIQLGNITIRASLLDTPTASAIWNALPITATAKTWGEEVYFDVPVSQDEESNAREVVTAGEIAFWPEGRAVAIGFGPTPISRGNEIRLVSPVNIWATALDDVKKLTAVKDGQAVSITKTD